VTVTSVNFGNDSFLLAQVSVSPTASPGDRIITVTNPDTRSSANPGLFSVGADQPPTVAITYPANQQTVQGTVAVSATASDDRGISRVEFLVDGSLKSTDTAFPYQFIWETGSETAGTYTLVVRAYDTASHMSQAQVSVTVALICDGPSVTGVSALANPFRLSVNATGLTTGFKVFIGLTPWTNIKIKSPTQFLIKGAKAYFPKDGSWVPVTIVNPDGCSTTFEYNRQTKSWRSVSKEGSHGG
jgi:hypothetical protein